MKIHVLPDQLASQIAAGEVVERPASVVKELIENALDAGATVVNVDVRRGGRELIQVADDGAGILASEVETAFLRHATSKLETASELNAIGTLGFRGEALAAIAAVSQVTLVTRTAGEPAGTRLVLEGGAKKRRDVVGAPQGTVIAVENLFFNVPARRKFLKSITTEKRQIDEFITRYALAYPEVRFRLVHDGRVTFQSNGTGDVRDVLVALYGADVARDLLEVTPAADGRGGSIAVSGYVGPPGLHRANRNQIMLFVNGRWVRDHRLTYAVIQAYHTLLPGGRYPVAVIFMRLPFDQVDVNVHPAKTEVRFRDGSAAFGAVQRAVRRTLTERAPVQRGHVVGLGAFRQPTRGEGWRGQIDSGAFGSRFEGQEQSALALGAEIGDRREIGAVDADEHDVEATPARRLGGERLPIMRVVGQVGAAYIIAEGPDGMFLIDQHAAHERILYERFMAARKREGIASQGLVASATVQLAPDQATLLGEHLALLNRLGFTIEPFGPNTFVVRAIPALLSRLDPAAALVAVVDDLEAGKQPLADEVEARIILRVCKTAAVKAGQSLSSAEMEAMIQQLEECQNPHTCPHGRPTLIHLSAAQLAKQFGRT
ncbi:MAG: DNA mismatch repair endonuclease MutL [Candidatus Promineifilaceae bacterium]|nr:DNA mismatch repair endonuclease MutL [Candidatus Promineifilaceae bacterium]